MGLVKIYFYRMSDGVFMYEDLGNPDDIFRDMPDGMEFTLTPPPSYDKTWRWVNGKWE